MEEKSKSRDYIVGFDLSNYDRDQALDELMSTKAGVKGLADSGIAKVPEIFTLPIELKHRKLNDANDIQSRVPIIDLEGYRGERHEDIVDQILHASRTWGIFQIENHGVPKNVMDNMLESVAKFHEQPKELKEEFYSHDSTRKVWYYMTVHPILRYALWKDTIAWQFDNISMDSEALPLICRKPMLDYIKYIIQIKDELCKLLSEALGLDNDHLAQMECMEARKLVGHYYPACPEPDLTMGTPKHSDPYFFTILLQNDIGGLQVLHQNEWIDVVPTEGALIAIVGDMLQLISNNVFTSAEHRVLASKNGPRLSTACFFYPSNTNKDRIYGPIKELVSENNPSFYKETTQVEYFKCFSVHGSCGSKALPLFRQQ